MTATPPPQLTLNARPRIDIRPLGTDGAVFVIDDVLDDPQLLIDHAISLPFGSPPEGSKYPGLVAPVPSDYLNLIAGVLQRPMIEVFGLYPERRLPAYGFFGLATVPPDHMIPAQAAPHTDAHKQNSYATVHYLSRLSFGGTAFYRHKATGATLVTPIGSDKFNYTRRRELAGLEGQPVAAIRDLYEEIDYIEPVFNRLILYRAGQLHSARMEDGVPLSAHPRAGRLTANLFFNTEGL